MSQLKHQRINYKKYYEIQHERSLGKMFIMFFDISFTGLFKIFFFFRNNCIFKGTIFVRNTYPKMRGSLLMFCRFKIYHDC